VIILKSSISGSESRLRIRIVVCSTVLNLVSLDWEILLTNSSMQWVDISIRDWKN